jgi:hypothetical protein
VVPEKYHDSCLYRSQEELVQKLCLILKETARFVGKREDLAAHMERYSWELVIDEYDEELNQLAGRH